jgi:hypothetical protein
MDVPAEFCRADDLPPVSSLTSGGYSTTTFDPPTAPERPARVAEEGQADALSPIRYVLACLGGMRRTPTGTAWLTVRDETGRLGLPAFLFGANARA